MNKNNTWRVVGASVTGTSHDKTGKPCQDAHYWQILPDGVLVAAIADGAGSAALAEVGADVAAAAAVEIISKRIVTPCDDDGWKLLLTNTLTIARKSVEAEAAVREVSVRDLASTLILVVATPVMVAAAMVGDGAAVMGDRSGKAIALTRPQKSEYLNETTFIISANAVETAQVNIWHSTPTHIAIFSDGLQRLALKMPDCEPHAAFFSPLFRFIVEETDETRAKERLTAFLRSPRVAERTDDDLTLLLATLIE